MAGALSLCVAACQLVSSNLRIDQNGCPNQHACVLVTQDPLSHAIHWTLSYPRCSRAAYLYDDCQLGVWHSENDKRVIQTYFDFCKSLISLDRETLEQPVISVIVRITPMALTVLSYLPMLTPKWDRKKPQHDVTRPH